MAIVQFELEEYKELEKQHKNEIRVLKEALEKVRELSLKTYIFQEDNVNELRKEIDELEHENLLCKRAYLDMNVMQFTLDEYAAGKKNVEELENVNFDAFEWHMVFKDLSMMKSLGISEEFAYEWVCEEVDRRKKETVYIKDEDVADIVNEVNNSN